MKNFKYQNHIIKLFNIQNIYNKYITGIWSSKSDKYRRSYLKYKMFGAMDILNYMKNENLKTAYLLKNILNAWGTFKYLIPKKDLQSYLINYAGYTDQAIKTEAYKNNQL